MLTDVRRTFYEVLIAQRTAELAAQLVRIGEEGVRSTEALMKAKEVAPAISCNRGLKRIRPGSFSKGHATGIWPRGAVWPLSRALPTWSRGP